MEKAIVKQSLEFMMVVKTVAALVKHCFIGKLLNYNAQIVNKKNSFLLYNLNNFYCINIVN